MYNSNNEFRSMKRAHSPDSFDAGNNNSFRGGHHNFRGGHHQHHHNYNNHQFHNKRHRGDHHGGYFQQQQTIEERISRLGDTGQRNVEIGFLVKDIDLELANKSNEDEKVKNITEHICKCVISFPTRIGTYSTLIGLISVKHYNVSCQIINSLHASYPVYLEAQKWQEALTIMHLFASLVNCRVIHPTSLLSQFHVLLQITEEQNIPQTRSDYYVYTVMSSIPYVAQELSIPSDPPNNFDQLLSKIEDYLNSRSKTHLNSVRVWQSNDQTVQMDYLDSLWVQMKNLRANNWNEMFLHRPYNDKEYKDIMTSSLIPQSPPTVNIPEHSPEFIYPNAKIVFRVFDDDVTEGPISIPGSDKIERFCIENHIKGIMDEIGMNDPRACVRHLSRMFHYDKLPLKHLLIETILGELFSLPKTKHNPLLYQTLLLEFNKIYRPSDKVQEIKTNYDYILNEAIKVLYQNLDSMSVTCITRFVEWFSFHLNNTEFIFPFIAWADAAADKEKTSPKAIFVQETLERCVRLTFVKKIKTIVQVSLPDFEPQEKKTKYQPIFSDNPNAQQLETIYKKLIFEKADGKTICETMNIIVDGVELPEGFMLREEKISDKLLKIDIFTSVLISIAAKSLTHLSSAIGKYKEVFKALVNQEGGQVQLLQSVHSCLEEYSQLEIIIVDKLLKAELVDAKEVCNWLFCDSMKPLYLNSLPWEILQNTIIRLLQLVKKLENERDEPIVIESKSSTINIKKESNDDDQNRPSTPTADDDNDKAKVGDNEVEIKKEVDGDEDIEMIQQKEREEQTHQAMLEHEARKANLQVKINNAKSKLDQTLMQIFSKFAEMINDHMKNCEANGLDYKDKWYKWIIGRMQEVYYNHYDTIQSQNDILKIILDYLNYK